MASKRRPYRIDYYCYSEVRDGIAPLRSISVRCASAKEAKQMFNEGKLSLPKIGGAEDTPNPNKFRIIKAYRFYRPLPKRLGKRILTPEELCVIAACYPSGLKSTLPEFEKQLSALDELVRAEVADLIPVSKSPQLDYQKSGVEFLTSQWATGPSSCSERECGFARPPEPEPQEEEISISELLEQATAAAISAPQWVRGVSVLMTNRGKLLLGKRKNTTASGIYSTPGGKLEEGESILEGAMREAQEETGIVDFDEENLVIIGEQEHEDRYGGNSGKKYHMTYVHAPAIVSWKGDVINTEPNKCEGWEWFDFSQIPENCTEPAEILSKVKDLAYDQFDPTFAPPKMDWLTTKFILFYGAVMALAAYGLYLFDKK
jgi:8-oxo-dGTP diphosphatase